MSEQPRTPESEPRDDPGAAIGAGGLHYGGPVRRWTTRLVLAAVVGVAAGLAAAVFLTLMHAATEAFVEHRLLLFGLPVAGLGLGMLYHHVGGRSGAGNNLILDEIREPQAWIPRRMGVLVLIGTVVTHLFGGSAGREGTAVQMAGSITDGLARQLRITGLERRILLVASIGAGFAGVFGVPAAGVVFALEIQAIGRVRRAALLPTIVASFVGDATVRGLGVTHDALPPPGAVHLSPGLLAKVILAGAAFGVASLAFAEAIHRTKALMARLVSWPPLRPVIGGVVIILLTGIVGTREYLGLSAPLIGLSVAGGAGIALGAFAAKIVFTAVTLGTGFYGGEVTPLFVVGSTLGVTMGHVLHAPIPLLAAAGLCAVFAGASNTPIASTVLGIELFGWHPALALVFAIACGVSYVASGSSSIYTSQQNRRWGFRHQTRTPA
ncbi:MAG: chloride channel protein [Aquihabitans sp.]